MGDDIRENYEDDQDPIEEFLVECQEETQLEIWGKQLEKGLLQDTSNKSLCKNTKYAQKFLVTPAKGMAYIHGTATKMTLFVNNAKHPLIIDNGANFSIVAKEYLEKKILTWENQLFQTKAKNYRIVSEKMTSIGTIIKEIRIPYRKGDIRCNPELVVL
ncbi:hypothetical protein O181_036549 [Austropuccinia psidii MF-1]|uniref:Uncharacterized protein n=1 Tax=Austropuccinia psidii MF-1 TaxID=1389203 RepID=A0A9Q3D4S2_9BASI|nr:hypothetical protein [Austropuccinia psidii MF-1]